MGIFIFSRCPLDTLWVAEMGSSKASRGSCLAARNIPVCQERCPYTCYTVWQWPWLIIPICFRPCSCRSQCFFYLVTPLYTQRHGLAKYKDTKTKCRLYWCLIEFIDWRNGQLCWYFRPSSVNYCPSNLLSSSPPSHTMLKYSTYIQTVCACMGGWGVELCWRPYSAGV